MLGLIGRALIPLRERALTRLFRSQGILNDGEPPDDFDPLDLPALLRELLKALKGAFITADGSAVDYAALRDHTLYSEYQQAVALLREFDPLRLRNRQDRLAFWINLYNLLVIDGVIRLGIRRTVREKTFGFAFFRRAAYLINGQRVTLDDIEHGILRDNRGHPAIPGAHFAAHDPRFAWILRPPDVRMHFALNCASQSCPRISYYEPERLDTQLDLAVRSFIHTEVQYVPERHQLHLSRLFQWYAADFDGHKGIVAFLQRYIPELESAGPPRFVYSPYDWSLNVFN